ncbi:MAG: stage III sporulation protein AE [Limnochordales bacterium]|nr:stage III sporulation protein AE [Limnochordales bacterium]
MLSPLLVPALLAAASVLLPAKDPTGAHLYPVALAFGVTSGGWPAGAAPAATGGMESAGQQELLQQTVERQAEALDLTGIEEFVAGLDQEVRAVFPTTDWGELLRRGGPGLDLPGLLQAALAAAVADVVGGSRILVQLLLVSILGALVTLLQQAWESSTAREVSLLALVLIIIFLSLQALRTAVGVAWAATEQMTGFMYALAPVLTTLLAGLGAVSSATLLHPLFLAVVTGVGLALRNVILPLALLGLAFRLAGTLARDLPLSRLAALAQTLSLTALGLGFTLFFGVLAIHGAVAPVTDSLGLRAAKFLSSSFIPVMGGMFAQALDVVVGGSLLLRNAVGAFGMAAVLVLVLFPLTKLGLFVIGFKLAAALAQPVIDPRLLEVMGAVENTLVFIAVCVGVAALIYFLMILITVAVGSFAANLV